MPFPLFHYPAGQEPPFTIFIEHQDKTCDQHWRPAASIQFGKNLRTSGFLSALPPEELKSFLLLLTFLSPNGDCGPSLMQLATALRLSPAKTRARLERLAATRWHGQPIIRLYRTESGLDLFRLPPGLLPIQEQSEKTDSSAPYQAAPREAIIAHSRRHYAHPRAEVERQIAEQNGWQKPEKPASIEGQFEEQIEEQNDASSSVDQASATNQEVKPEQIALRRELLHVGLRPDQADELLAQFDAVRIRRQLMWLPQRAVRNRVGFLIAAIKDDYAAPEFRTTSRFHKLTALEEKSDTITNHLAEPAPPVSQERAHIDGVNANMPLQALDDAREEDAGEEDAGEEDAGELAELIVRSDLSTAERVNPSLVSYED